MQNELIFEMPNQNELVFEEQVFIQFLKERKIIINQEIDDSLVERMIMQIIKWNEEDKDIPINKRQEIKIYINTLGGDVSVGMAGVSCILASKTPVHGIVLGYAYSMGALLLIACHKRSMFKGSSCLIHGGSIALQNSAKKAKSIMNFYSKVDKQINKFITERTKISKELLEQKMEADEEWYLTSDECLELGLVDEIIE